MNNRPLLNIYQAFSKYSQCCPADESIGIRVAAKFLRYCLNKEEQFNQELIIHRLEKDKEGLLKKVKRLEIKVDDLTEDLKVYENRKRKLA